MATTEETQSATFLKFLIPNKAAGLIIGKSGAAIIELQSATGAVIKVNNATAGVSERVLIVAGALESVTAALDKVLGSLRDAEVDPSATAPPADLTVRLLVPPAAAPVIIGHAGTTIKELQTTTNTTIRIANRLVSTNGRRPSISEEDDRQVTISGPLANVHAALSALLPHTCKYSRYESEVSLREALSKSTRATAAAAAPEYPAELYNTTCTIEFYVANEEAGAIIGRSGRRIRELGNRIQASVSRHDEVDAENRRKVTLTGPVRDVHKAHMDVLNWLKEHREVANAHSGQSSATGSPAPRQPTQAPQQQAPTGMLGTMGGFGTMNMIPQFQMNPAMVPSVPHPAYQM